MNVAAPSQPLTRLTVAQVNQVLAQVLDPEVPVLSVLELGIVREVLVDPQDGGVQVTVTPTYSGCPATEVIRDSIIAALQAAGAGHVTVTTRLAPAWTTDWIAPEAGEKLRQYGIAPPHLCDDTASDSTPANDASTAPAARPLRFHPRNLACPRCLSSRTEQLSAFGSTACKSLFRCLDCREPFEYFKPI